MNLNVPQAEKGVQDREALARLFGRMDFKAGAEIGVHVGDYSIVLLDNIPDLTLYCIDRWQTDTDRRIAATRERLAPYPKTIIWKMRSVRAVRHIPDGSLDFVYIDASHAFGHVMQDLNIWEPKVRVGGVVAGHDYSLHAQMQVLQAVNTYIQDHPVNLYMTVDEQEFRSFYWVKE